MTEVNVVCENEACKRTCPLMQTGPDLHRITAGMILRRAVERNVAPSHLIEMILGVVEQTARVDA